jgi:hypothetical protein
MMFSLPFLTLGIKIVNLACFFHGETRLRY